MNEKLYLAISTKLIGAFFSSINALGTEPSAMILAQKQAGSLTFYDFWLLRNGNLIAHYFWLFKYFFAFVLQNNHLFHQSQRFIVSAHLNVLQLEWI